MQENKEWSVFKEKIRIRRTFLLKSLFVLLIFLLKFVTIIIG